MPSGETKFLLRENQIPSAWFNVVPSRPTPPSPPLHAGTMQPIGPDDLAPLFPMALIGQEVTTQEWIDIPGPVLDVYRTYRPSPLHRARRASTTSTKACRRRGPTSQTPPSPRPITTRRRACGGWRPRRAPASGAAP